MKILITGASGFIGSFLVEEALTKGWEVWAGIRPESNLKNLTYPGIRFITLSYDKPALLQQQIANHFSEYGRWDYVIHNAGITKSIRKNDFDKINHQYTTHFAQALIQANAVPDCFLYISSMGAVGAVQESSCEPLSLKDKPSPDSAYGLSKLAAEKDLAGLKDFTYQIVRPTGVYGPRDPDYLLVFKMIQKGLDVSIGLKKQLLSFIYVKDLARVCIQLLQTNKQNSIWFVADGDTYTSEAFSRLIRKTLGKRFVLSVKIPLFLVWLAAQLGELLSALTGKTILLNKDKFRILKQRNWTCEITPLKNELNFVPDYPLGKGLSEAIEWYKLNQLL